jgi:hypothetical protein
MVKEACGKVDSVRVTSNGFVLIIMSLRREGESIVFRSRAPIKCVISGVSLKE